MLKLAMQGKLLLPRPTSVDLGGFPHTRRAYAKYLFITELLSSKKIPLS